MGAAFCVSSQIAMAIVSPNQSESVAPGVVWIDLELEVELQPALQLGLLVVVIGSR